MNCYYHCFQWFWYDIQLQFSVGQTYTSCYENEKVSGNSKPGVNKHMVFWKLLGNIDTQITTKTLTIKGSLPHPQFSPDLWSLYLVELIFICLRIVYAALCNQVTTIFQQFSKLFQTKFLSYDLCDHKSTKRSLKIELICKEAKYLVGTYTNSV